MNTDFEKIASSLGKAAAFAELGFPAEVVSRILVDGGFKKEAVDALLEKTAFVPAAVGTIGRLLIGGGRALARGAGGMAARGAAQRAAPAAGLAARAMGRTTQAVGGLGQQAGRGLARSGIAFAKDPGQAMLGGAKEMGKSMIFGSGKGLGGTIGKGIYAGGAASMFMPKGQEPQPNQQMQLAQPMPYGQ